MTMTTIYHPAMPVEMQVDSSAVDDWAEQGWRKTKPTHDDPSAAAGKSGDDKKGK